MKKIKVGIVGLGRLGKEYARNIAFKIKDAELVAACSLSEDELAFEYWILLRNDILTLVSICVFKAAFVGKVGGGEGDAPRVRRP